MMDIKSFLINAKAHPTNNFVIGNDAGDADSIVSAIALAYINSLYAYGNDVSVSADGDVDGGDGVDADGANNDSHSRYESSSGLTPIVSISKDAFLER